MAERGMPTDQPVVQQETVTVPQGHDSIVVRLRGHTWVGVSTYTHQLVRNESPDPVIAFTLAPGTYVVRTDGKIESVTTESFRQEPSLFEQFAARNTSAPYVNFRCARSTRRGWHRRSCRRWHLLLYHYDTKDGSERRRRQRKRA